MSQTVYCTRCDLNREDRAAPCACGCAHWSRSDRATVTRLVEDNVRLVGWTVNGVMNRFNDVRSVEDELMSAGQLALLRAARQFDTMHISPRTGRPVAFSTFAVVSIRLAVHGCLSDELWRQGHEQQGPKDDGNGGDWFHGAADDAPGPDAVLLSAERSELTATAIEALPPVWAHVIRGRMDGETLIGLGDQLGITKERVRQIQKSGVAFLRERFDRA